MAPQGRMMVESADKEDQRLDDLVRDGDQQALAQLFDRNRRRLRQIIATRLDSRLRGRVDPSDVLQEAFVDLARRLPNFANRIEHMSIFVWMRLVATERVLATHREHLGAKKRDARREQKLRVNKNSATSMCLAENMLANFSSPDDHIARKELQRILMETLDSMEQVDQEIILMRAFENLSNAEAAESLGISPNGASNRYVRAMSRLHKELKSTPGFMDY